MHYKIPYIYLKPITDIEKLNLTSPYIRPKKLKVSWFDFLICFLQYLQHTFLICKKYSKFIKELVEFINDSSITCSICSTQVFDCYLCRIQYKKNCLFFKTTLTPLFFLCKVYRESDCHHFDKYKHKKSF